MPASLPACPPPLLEEEPSSPRSWVQRPREAGGDGGGGPHEGRLTELMF